MQQSKNMAPSPWAAVAADAGESKYTTPLKEAHAEASRTVPSHKPLLHSVMTGMPGNPENKSVDHSLHLTEARQDRG